MKCHNSSCESILGGSGLSDWEILGQWIKRLFGLIFVKLRNFVMSIIRLEKCLDFSGIGKPPVHGCTKFYEMFFKTEYPFEVSTLLVSTGGL